MLEIEVLYEDGHREKQSLKNIRKLKTDKVQYIIVWKDDLILREVCSYDFYYIIWDKDWIILEGFDQREAGKVYFKKNEPNKTENRDYIEITRMAIITFPNYIIFEGSYTEKWNSEIQDKVKKMKGIK